jgi:aspartyl-tRNA(Asn)/glutamyl-tRNA(Gln) amidotransferase subunit B
MGGATESSEGAGMKFAPVIGLEIHAELRTNSKMFCGCPADHFGKEPNTQVCPVCFGLPGALPVANGEAIRRAVMIGVALECEVATVSKFDRKNYFYPDLPKGYQISQYDQPLCFAGSVNTSLGPVRITRVHLEEDTAKLQHVTLSTDEQRTVGVAQSTVSLLDFNRSGVPLVEIVTEPDIRSGEHAREFGKKLVQLLRYLGVTDADMEKGSLRLEANISVQTEEEKAADRLPAYKVEVKNLNSFRFLERSINYEIARQSEIRATGELPVQETRGWNDDKGVTYSQRVKEEAADYRYFPDPDLPPLVLAKDWKDEIAGALPELPDAKLARWVSQFGLSAQSAEVGTSNRSVAEALESLLEASSRQQLEPQKVMNAVLNHKVETWLLDSERVVFASKNEIHAEQQRVLSAVCELYATDSVDASVLEKAISEVLATPEGQDALLKYRSGKTQVIGFILGQVMRKIQGKVDPKAITKEIKKRI